MMKLSTKWGLKMMLEICWYALTLINVFGLTKPSNWIVQYHFIDEIELSIKISPVHLNVII